MESDDRRPATSDADDVFVDATNELDWDKPNGPLSATFHSAQLSYPLANMHSRRHIDAAYGAPSLDCSSFIGGAAR